MNIIAAQAITCLGFDTNAFVSHEQLLALWQAGYRTMFGYLPFHGITAGLSRAQFEDALAIGYQVGLVQHVRYEKDNIVARYSGSIDALAACVAAMAIGYPKGGHIYQDLEGVIGSRDECTKFATDFASTVVLSGYRAGLYHGFGVPMDSLALYQLRFVDSYWTDAANRPIAHRGNAIVQKPTVKLAGVEIDPDEIAPDSLGETPFFAMASALAEVA
jgi:hypothetical protein